MEWGHVMCNLDRRLITSSKYWWVPPKTLIHTFSTHPIRPDEVSSIWLNVSIVMDRNEET
jgi:hypothetical protein